MTWLMSLLGVSPGQLYRCTECVQRPRGSEAVTRQVSSQCANCVNCVNFWPPLTSRHLSPTSWDLLATSWPGQEAGCDLLWVVETMRVSPDTVCCLAPLCGNLSPSPPSDPDNSYISIIRVTCDRSVQIYLDWIRWGLRNMENIPDSKLEIMLRLWWSVGSDGVLVLCIVIHILNFQTSEWGTEQLGLESRSW